MIPVVFVVGSLMYEGGKYLYQKGKEEGAIEEKKASSAVSNFTIKKQDKKTFIYVAVISVAVFLAMKKGN